MPPQDERGTSGQLLKRPMSNLIRIGWLRPDSAFGTALASSLHKATSGRSPTAIAEGRENAMGNNEIDHTIYPYTVGREDCKVLPRPFKDASQSRSISRGTGRGALQRGESAWQRDRI